MQNLTLTESGRAVLQPGEVEVLVVGDVEVKPYPSGGRPRPFLLRLTNQRILMQVHTRLPHELVF